MVTGLDLTYLVVDVLPALWVELTRLVVLVPLQEILEMTTEPHCHCHYMALLDSDLHPDVPGQPSAGPDTSQLEISHSDLLVVVVAASLLFTKLPRISGNQLLQGPPHLPAGSSGLLLALAAHQVDLPAGEDGGGGRRLPDLRVRGER